jgi:hypothetical protein
MKFRPQALSGSELRTSNLGSRQTPAPNMLNEHSEVPSTAGKGSRRPFPKYRETVLDIIRVSQNVPSFPLIRTMQLKQLACVRKEASSRIAWSTLFAKAYGLVCARLPELREIFVPYPRKHLYRHPHSVASLSVHRQDDSGNERLIWGRWKSPESTPLVELQQQLDAFSHAPMNQVFREGLILERRSALTRRFVWWWVTHWSGRNRAKHVGTFSISSVGGQGCLNAYHPLVTTSSLAFGPIDTAGFCEVVLICDHRTLDGVLGARALEMLEQVLSSQIAEEVGAPIPLSTVSAA